MELKQSWKDYIKAEIRKDISGSQVLRGEIRGIVNCWDLDGFSMKWQAEQAYREYMIACQIRTYCRRNKITTRRGAYHGFNCCNEHQKLWQMVISGGMEGEVDGLKWSYRTVDGLKNLYLFF